MWCYCSPLTKLRCLPFGLAVAGLLLALTHLQAQRPADSAPQLDRIFAGNDTVRRGAVLHADVGMLAPEDLSRRASQMALRTFVVQDGRQQGARGQTIHWQLGRLLLDGITPSPANDAGTLLWYRASSAYLLREGHLDEARLRMSTIS